MTLHARASSCIRRPSRSCENPNRSTFAQSIASNRSSVTPRPNPTAHTVSSPSKITPAESRASRPFAAVSFRSFLRSIPVLFRAIRRESGTCFPETRYVIPPPPAVSTTTRPPSRDLLIPRVRSSAASPLTPRRHCFKMSVLPHIYLHFATCPPLTPPKNAS
jgi:hypothetical protein